jgi:hypothetical protein
MTSSVSHNSDGDDPDARDPVTGVAATPTNFERLQAHLKTGSLAERLLAAQVAAAPGMAQAALKQILADRLNELRRTHAGTPEALVFPRLRLTGDSGRHPHHLSALSTSMRVVSDVEAGRSLPHTIRRYSTMYFNYANVLILFVWLGPIGHGLFSLWVHLGTLTASNQLIVLTTPPIRCAMPGGPRPAWPKRGENHVSDGSQAHHRARLGGGGRARPVNGRGRPDADAWP